MRCAAQLHCVTGRGARCCARCDCVRLRVPAPRAVLSGAGAPAPGGPTQGAGCGAAARGAALARRERLSAAAGAPAPLTLTCRSALPRHRGSEGHCTDFIASHVYCSSPDTALSATMLQAPKWCVRLCVAARPDHMHARAGRAGCERTAGHSAGVGAARAHGRATAGARAGALSLQRRGGRRA